MLDKDIRKKIRDLISREVIPAVGCTEPAAVALAVAKATEILESEPIKINVSLSGNVLKNAMGVGIPGTGMIGLPIAIALGAIVGRSEYGLEVLKNVNEDAVKEGRRMIDASMITVSHCENAPSNLYIRATVINKTGHEAEAVICYEHTNFIFLRCGNEVLLDKSDESSSTTQSCDDENNLNLSMVWEYATESPLEELEHILMAKELNEEAAKLALDGTGMGHKVGKTIHDSRKKYFGDSVLSSMLAMTSGACDARMAGEPIAVMSNSGSGNQGIAITMPVVAYAKEIGADMEATVRALTMAHLTSIYIKQSLGRLSALCGCVVASTGASMALVYLMGGEYRQGAYAVKNMIATLTGMICDGAKPACSLKIASGVSTAYIASLMAMNNHYVTSNEGIIDDCVDNTIENFAMIGREAMLETDRTVLRIMSGSN